VLKHDRSRFWECLKWDIDTTTVDVMEIHNGVEFNEWNDHQPKREHVAGGKEISKPRVLEGAKQSKGSV